MDTKKSPLPPLEDLAEAVEALMAAGLKPDKDPRKELEKLPQAEGTARHWFAEPRDHIIRDTMINSHLGAASVMTPGRIQDPEGAKTVVVSVKTAAGAILAVNRQTYKIVCFKDNDSGRLRVDTSATIGGKQDMNKQSRRVMLIYKAHMYTEVTLDPERCAHTSDEKAMRNWLQTHLRQIDQYEDIDSPARDQHEDDTMEEADAGTEQPDRIELPPNGSGAHAPTQGAAAARVEGGTATAGASQPIAPTRLSFGTPEPPTIPNKSLGGTAPDNPNTVEHQNRFAPLRQ